MIACKKKYFLLLVLISFTLLLYSCSVEETVVEPEIRPLNGVKVAKWYNAHPAVVSITYDIGFNLDQRVLKVVDETEKLNLALDFEVVTAFYNTPQFIYLTDIMRQQLMPNKIRFFGHGHEHINHDELSFEDAYTSFKLCFDLMQKWGLEPIVYAYPGARGRLATTQLANKLAGFIAARGAVADPYQAFICPDDLIEPDNWFDLPAVIMGSIDPININNNAELIPILETNVEKTSWVLLLYHSIGIEGGWAYYPMDEFLLDINTIKSMDVWSGNFDNVTKYIYQKNAFEYETEFIKQTPQYFDYRVIFKDYLPNNVFNHELTISFDLLEGVHISEVQLFDKDVLVSQSFEKDSVIYLNVLPDEKFKTLRFLR